MKTLTDKEMIDALYTILELTRDTTEFGRGLKRGNIKQMKRNVKQMGNAVNELVELIRDD